MSTKKRCWGVGTRWLQPCGGRGNRANMNFHKTSKQELLHVYLPVKRFETLEAAFGLLQAVTEKVIPLNVETVLHAKDLALSYGGLSARDLIHLACCQQNSIRQIKTYDRGLESAFRKRLKGG